MERYYRSAIGGMAVAIMLALGSANGGNNANTPEERARAFIRYYEEQVRPLEIAVNLAWWQANITGKDEDFKAKEEAQNKLDAALSNRERFAELKALHGQVQDRLLARANPPALPGPSGKASRAGTAAANHQQSQRHRKGVQRLPGSSR
jgi:hypothetical protein